MKQAKLALLYRDVVSDAKLINSMPASARRRAPSTPYARWTAAACCSHQRTQRRKSSRPPTASRCRPPCCRTPGAGSAYTRTKLVDADDWSLSLICWAPGAASPIHNHVELTSGEAGGCMMRVLGGELHETRYDRLLLPQPERRLEPGTASYIAGESGIHKIQNKGLSGAISLHLCAPKVFESEIFAENAFAFDGGVGLKLDRCRTRGREGALCVRVEYGGGGSVRGACG